MKIIWVHNYSYPSYIGGAELSDHYWIKEGKRLGINLKEITYNSKPLFADAYILGNFSKFDKDYLAKISQKPYICIIHGSLIDKDSISIYKKAKLLIFMSPMQRKKYQNIFKNSKNITIPPFIDAKSFYDYKKDREINSYLYVGAISTRKGIPEILKHAKIHPQNQYHFYGPIRKEPSLIRQIEKSKNCTYHKSIKNNKIPKIMNRYENFIWIINPRNKYFESFGRTIAEAILCNLNLVISKKNFGIFSWKWDFDNQEEVKKNLLKRCHQFWNVAMEFLR